MIALLFLIALGTVLGLRKRHFDLQSFAILFIVILGLVVYQHMHALYAPQVIQ